MSGRKYGLEKTCGTALLSFYVFSPLTTINQKFDFMKLASLFCVAVWR